MIVLILVIAVLLMCLIGLMKGRAPIRDCLCGGRIFAKKGAMDGKSFIMGGASCDKCGSTFNSSVGSWTDSQLREALLKRGVKL